MCKINNLVGKKHDGGKVRMDLIPPEVLLSLGKVLTYGAEKYAPNNWQMVESDRYVAAFLRHYVAWRKGEKIDMESGLMHLEHMLANVSFLLYKEMNDE
jgi:hypothetical protein